MVRAPSVRLDQPDQRAPGDDLVHLVEEDFLARLLGQRVKAQIDLFHAAHPRPQTSASQLGVTWGFADLP
jgi:hypothetical protein